MELHCKLDPESVRKLSLRLYGEEALKADPAAVIFNTIDWIDQVTGNTEVHVPAQNDLVRQLAQVVKTQGLPNVAAGLQVSSGAIRGWLHGTQPSPLSYQKIERFLADSESTPTDAAGAGQRVESGELFIPDKESGELTKPSGEPLRDTRR
jgi:hypothetical protein